ncbi:MAG: hypothetical protein Q9166_005039 [cf. Caloplaca sp. 2 TL-2023]
MAADTSQVEPDLNTYETGFTPGAKGDIGLTTIFTPPNSCLDTVTYDGTSFWQGGLLQTGDQKCYPPQFLDIFWSQYTPGICPHGWMSLSGAGAFTQSDGNIELITIDPKTVESNTIYADIIGIHWAETDSQILRLMSQTTSSSPTAAPTNAAQTAHRTIPAVSPTTSASVTFTPSPGGLSTGAEAGIGIGAVVGAVAMALFAYFLWRRRRKSKNMAGNTEANPTRYHGVHELDSKQEKNHPQQRAEIPPQLAHELPADEGRSELGSDAATNRNAMW